MSFFGIKWSRPEKSGESASEGSERQELSIENSYDSILGKKLFKEGKKTVFRSNVKQLLDEENGIDVWELNRPMDVDHVRLVKEAYENEWKLEGYITTYGTFGVFKDGERYKLFDGQHRLEAFRQFLEQYSEANPTIIVDFYESRDPIRLFTNLNQIKPMEEHHRPTNRKEQISKLLSEKWGDAIKTIGSKTKRPCVMKKDLMDAISDMKMEEKSPIEIMEWLINLNTKFSYMSMPKLFGKEYQGNEKITTCNRIHDKAKELNFFIALRKKKNSRLDWTI